MMNSKNRTYVDEESLEDFNVANTMSTPMLVNDWQNPHRTLLVIAAPEKPFDAAEAAALHDFVTERAGKVILASNSTNAQLVAEEFGVKYFDSPIRDDINTGRYYEVTNDEGLRVSPDTRKIWSVASVTRDVSTMGDEKATPCSTDDVKGQNIENCRMPVLFHRPTAIQVLDEQGDTGRNVRSIQHRPPLKSTLEKAIQTQRWEKWPHHTNRLSWTDRA